MFFSLSKFGGGSLSSYPSSVDTRMTFGRLVKYYEACLFIEGIEVMRELKEASLFYQGPMVCCFLKSIIFVVLKGEVD